MFTLRWDTVAQVQYDALKADAEQALATRKGKGKSSKAEGLFKQVHKCITHLRNNPRHPGLHTHEFNGMTNPYDKNGKVFEAYAQNKTPGAYRVFWCYGPSNRELTILAITPHP